MSRTNKAYQPMKLKFFGILTCLIAAPANSDPIVDTVFPLTYEQFTSYNAFIGGTRNCDASGAYDADTFIWTETGKCVNSAGQNVSEGSGFAVPLTQASLAGQVNNSGQVLNGAFSLIGMIPDLDVNNISILASGRLIDAYYGSTDYGSTSTFPGPYALIDLDYLVEPFSDFGSLLLWTANSSFREWNPPSCVAGDYSCAWTTSITYSDSRLTGSQYFFYDRAAILPEPGTLALFAIGLLGVGLVGRRAQQ